MADIKCSRCDRRYSAFRSRCPYCGTRRRKSGKRVSESDNATWKLIIGILLLVILVAAVIILLVTSLSGGKEPDTDPDVSTTPSFSQGDGVIDAENTASPSESPSPSPSPSETPPAVLTAESAEITWNGNLRTDVSMKTGEELQFGVRTVPAEVEDTPIWSSDNEDVFIVLQSGKVTAVSKGTATLTVTCGAASASCIIRVTG